MKWTSVFGRQNKQLKNLWSDYCTFPTDSQDANRIKSFTLFVDGIVSTSNPSSSDPTIELIGDFEAILKALTTNLHQEFKHECPRFDDVDVGLKILTALNVLCSKNGILAEVILQNESLLLDLMGVLEYISNAEQFGLVISVIGCLLKSISNLVRLIEINGFQLIFEMAGREQLLPSKHLVLKFLGDILRSSARTKDLRKGVPGGLVSNQMHNIPTRGSFAQQSSEVDCESEEKEKPVSLAARGLNLAANMFGELLKFTPITAPWGKSEGVCAKDRDLSEDITLSQIELLAVPLDALTDESNRIDCSLSDCICFDSSSTEFSVSDHFVNQSAFPLLFRYMESPNLSDSLQVLLVVQIMLQKNLRSQYFFFKFGGYGRIVAMLVLLDKEQDNEKGGDDILNHFLRVLIEIIVDDSVGKFDKFGLPSRSCSINNINSLEMLSIMFSTRKMPLILFAIRLSFLLLRSHSINVVSLERMGVLSACSECLTYLVLRGPSHIFDTIHWNASEERAFVELISDICVVLQLCSVAHSCKDSSIAGLFIALISASITQKDTLVARCQNCEDEIQLECLHEQCIADRKSQLCRECDRVFHKSFLKRSHIRLPAKDHLFTSTWSKVVDLKSRSTSVSIELCQLFIENGFLLEESIVNKFRPQTLCVLMSAVRGIIDDRKSRSQSIPFVFFESLVSSLRIILITGGEVLAGCGSSQCVQFSEIDFSRLSDCRHDVFSSRNDFLHIYHDNVEPNIHSDVQNSPRRVLLSLLLQSISRLFIFDQSIGTVVCDSVQLSDYHSTWVNRRECIDSFVNLSCDAMFAHLISSNCVASQCCHILLMDVHFVIWSLREAAVTALNSCPEHVNQILKWFVWLISSPIRKYTLAMEEKAKDGVRAFEENPKYAVVPSERPRILPETRRYLLQDLRLLMGGGDVETLKNRTNYFAGIDVFRLGITGGTEDEKGFMPNSTQIQVPIARIPKSSIEIKKYLLKLGAIDYLLKIVVGDLCNQSILHLFMNSVSIESKVTESEMVDWWDSFVTLWQIIINCDEIKVELEASKSLTVIMNMVLVILGMITDGYIEQPQSDLNTLSMVLSTFIVEICVEKGRFTSPTPPFFACMVTRHSETFSALEGCPRELFVKSALATLSKYGLWVESDSAPSIHFPPQLSPFYVSRDRTLCQFISCLISNPLAFSLDLLSKKMVSSSQFNSTVPVSIAPSFPLWSSYWTSSQDDLSKGNSVGNELQSSDSIALPNTRRRSASIRSKMSSSSLQNLEYDHWDNESIHSATTSQHSLNIVASVMRIFPSGTPPASLNGDTPTILLSQRKGLFSSRLSVDHRPLLDHDVFDSKSLRSYFPIFEGLEQSQHVHIEKLLYLFIEAMIYKSGLNAEVCDDEEVLLSVPEMEFDSSAKFNLRVQTSAAISMNSLKRQLQMFLPPKPKFSDWQPQFSRLRIRSQLCAEILVTVSLLCGNVVQNFLVTVLSFLLEGNPHSLSLFNLIHVTFLVDLVHLLPEKQKGLYSHLLAQILKFDINSDILMSLIQKLCAVKDFNILDVIVGGKQFSSSGVISTLSNRECVDTQSSADFLSCGNSSSQLLFALGKAAKRHCPNKFLYFDQTSSLSGGIIFPPISVSMESRPGFSISGWIRLGCLGSKPVATLCQLSFEGENSSHIIDVFFRSVVRHRNDGDGSSVSSGNSALGGDSEDCSRKVLQLCISFGGPGGVPLNQQQNSVKKTNPQRWAQVAGSWLKESIGSINSDSLYLSSSLCRHAVSDFVVDFDWMELGEWHFLNLSFFEELLKCSIDGQTRPMLSWSRAGYVDISTPMRTPKSSAQNWESSINLKSVSGSIRKNGGVWSFGVQHVEHRARLRLIDYVESLVQDTKAELESAEVHVQEILSLMHAHESIVGGYCGMVGEVLLLDGFLDDSQVKAICSEGPSTPLNFLGVRKMSGLVPSQFSSDATFTKELSSKRLVKERSLSPTNVGVCVSEIDSDKLNCRKGTEKSSKFQNPESHIPAPSSLVSDLFTRFAGTAIVGKEVDPRTFHPNVLGRVKYFSTSYLAEALRHYGGVKLFYPLLVADSGRQVATLRVLSDVVLSSSEYYSEFLSSFGDKVILFCCHKTPDMTSLETLQVLFDSSTFPGNGDHFTRVAFLSLLIDISVACPGKPNLARCTVDWLKGVCDDVVDNSTKFLENIGIIPIMIILSLWNSESCKQWIRSDYRMACGSFGNSTEQELELCKLQLSVGLFLRQLITGTSGQHQLLEHYPPLTCTSTATGFTSSNIATCLALVSHSLRNLDVPGKCFTVSADRNILSIGITPGESSVVWAITTSLIVLDAIISAAEGPLLPVMVPIIRSSFPHNGIWNVVFNLLGSEFSDIRARGLVLLSLSLSSPDGRLDSKQVSAFEKINGFLFISDQLSRFVPDAVIMDLLLKLLFWRKSVYVLLHDVEKRVKARSEVKPGSRDSRVPAVDKQRVDLDSDSLEVDLEEKRSAASQSTTSNAAVSAGILSLFSWRSISTPIEVKGNKLDASFGNETSDLITDRASEPILSADSLNLPFSVPVASDSSPTEINDPSLEVKSDSIDRAPQLLPSDFVPVSTIELDEIESIQIPQIFQTIMKCLCKAPNVLLVTTTVRQIERSISLHSKDTMRPIRHQENIGGNFSASVDRNVEALFSQRDFLIWAADCLAYFRRRFGSREELEGNGEAIGTIDDRQSVLVDDQFAGADDSDEEKDSSDRDVFVRPAASVSSAADDSKSSQSWSGNGYHNEHQEQLLASYSDPIFNVVEKLLTHDMRAKPNSSRRWNEIFRLSTPDLCPIQDILMFDSLQWFEDFPFANRTFCTEIVLNFLKNFGSLLENYLEKIDISLDFCVRVIQTMHALNYKCPPEIRAKLRETNLSEVRNSYVLRCFLICFHGQGGGLISRVIALREINSSLLGYISTTEPRILQAHHVSLYIISLLFEVIDEHDALDEIDMRQITDSREALIINERIQMLSAAAHVILSLSRSCATQSLECKKGIAKVIGKVASEEFDYILQALMGKFSDQKLVVIGLESRSAPDRKQEIDEKQSRPPVSLNWWSGWSHPEASSLESSDCVESKALADSSACDHRDQVITAIDTPTDLFYPDKMECSFDEIDLKLLEEKELTKFISWTFSRSQKSIWLEIKSRLQKEMVTVLKQMERLHDKNKRKISIHESSVQDKLAKDRVSHEKVFKDFKDRVKAFTEKQTHGFNIEVRNWMDGLMSRVEKGKVEFDSQLQVPLSSFFRLFLSSFLFICGLILFSGFVSPLQPNQGPGNPLVHA